MVLYLTQQLISVKNVSLKIVFLAHSKMGNHSVTNAAPETHSTLMANALISVNLAMETIKESVKNVILVKLLLQVTSASLVLKLIQSAQNARQWIQMEFSQKNVSHAQMD